MGANNMAAMHEALAVLNRINTIGLKRLLVELVEADIFDGGLINKTISAVENARRVLSAPPRNCDMFQTKDAAREAFQKLRKHRVWADVSLWDDRDEIELFLDWLFAPAAERRGESDGK